MGSPNSTATLLQAASNSSLVTIPSPTSAVFENVIKEKHSKIDQKPSRWSPTVSISYDGKGHEFPEIYMAVTVIIQKFKYAFKNLALNGGIEIDPKIDGCLWLKLYLFIVSSFC